jgi:hypothetical protein
MNPLVVVEFWMIALVVVLLVTVRSPIEARVATSDDTNELVEVLLVLVKFVMNPVVALRRVAKKLDEVAFVITALLAVRLVIVVVASVEVPTTVNFPFAKRFPCASAKKLRFSVHADPFQ